MLVKTISLGTKKDFFFFLNVQQHKRSLRNLANRL